MAWIESHQSLRDSHKLYDLMASMEWEIHEAIGRLQMFWWWCVDHAEDGDLTKFKPHHLAIAAGLSPTEGKKFLEGMIEAGFIDLEPGFRLHDWWDYFGTFLRKRYSKRPEVWQRVRDLYQKEPPKEDGRGNPRGTEGDSPRDPEGVLLPHPKEDGSRPQPDLTKPDLTKPRESTPKPPEGAGGASPPGCSEKSPEPSRQKREDRAQVKSAMVYPDVLQVDGFKAEFEDWIEHRMGLKKPGVSWSVFFQRQLDKELAPIGSVEAFEKVTHSTLQGYTGLYSRPRANGPKRAPTEEEIDQTEL